MFLDAATTNAAGELVMETGRELVARWEMANSLSEWISGVNVVDDSRAWTATTASVSAGLTESTSRQCMSGMSTMTMGRSFQSGLAETNTRPAVERVSMLLSGVERLKIRERGFIVCFKDPSEYCVEPSGNESAMS